MKPLTNEPDIASMIAVAQCELKTAIDSLRGMLDEIENGPRTVVMQGDIARAAGIVESRRAALFALRRIER